VRLGIADDPVDRDGLFVGADYRGSKEARKIRAFAAEPRDGLKSLFNRIDRVLALGEIEKRLRVRPRDLHKH
jgi:hypothetical protein